MSDDRLDRMGRLDSCAVSDALDSLRIAGAVTGLTQFSGQGKISGRVVTVTLAPGDPPAGPPRHLCAAAIDSARPGDVIVVEHSSGVVCGGWGGLLSLGAKLRGIAGVIVEGFARDIEDCRAVGFPVFARALTTLTARGRIVERATNAPITVGGILVRPDDLVVADGSGVAFIPAEQADHVLDAAERIARREAAMARALREGKAVGEVMGADYEHMLKDEGIA